MKKIVTLAFLLLSIKVCNSQIVFDPSNYAQSLITAGSTKLTAIATERIAALANQQLAAADKAVTEALKANKINTDQFNLLKKYQEELKSPNNNFSGGPYASVEASYRRVVDITAISVMFELSTDELSPFRASVALFIAAARSNAEDLKTKVDAIKKKEIFTMNDAERLNLIDKYQSEMSVLLGAIKLYYARVVKILVSKKGVSSSSLSRIQKIIS
jgi:hypothetical protein